MQKQQWIVSQHAALVSWPKGGIAISQTAR
jgi:hypothetical protein